MGSRTDYVLRPLPELDGRHAELLVRKGQARLIGTRDHLDRDSA